jgi:hypothetical protein
MAPTRLTTEYKEFLRSLTAHRVEFLVVGGYAVGYHGFPRATVDIGVWVSRSEENARRLLGALTDFGFGAAVRDVSDLNRPNRILRMGLPPNRIEVLTDIDGVAFEPCRERRVLGVIDGIELPIISLEDLKANKRASGRHKDLVDLANLP